MKLKTLSGTPCTNSIELAIIWHGIAPINTRCSTCVNVQNSSHTYFDITLVGFGRYPLCKSYQGHLEYLQIFQAMVLLKDGR